MKGKQVKTTSGYRMNIEIFEDTAEMLKVSESRPHRRGEDTAESRLRSNWHGVSSLDEMRNLCENGWSAKTPEVMALVKEVQRRIPSKRVQTFNSVCGFAPVVPLALSGSPMSMLDSRTLVKTAKTVDLYYDMTMACMYKADDLLDAGMAMLEYIMRLEAQGYRVRLSSVTSYSDRDSADMCVVRIKPETRPFSIERMCFPLFNPAMFRVAGFLWYERTPEGKSRAGYGRAMRYTLGGRLEPTVREAFGQNSVIVSAVDIVEAIRKGRSAEDVLNSAFGA